MYIKSQNSNTFVNGLIAQLEERSSLEPMVTPMVVGSNPGRDTISKNGISFLLIEKTLGCVPMP